MQPGFSARRFIFGMVLVAPLPAMAEATWADLFPFLGKAILLGLPIELAQFCIGLWPWFLGLTLICWGLRWRRAKAGKSSSQTDYSSFLRNLIFRPEFLTGLTALMILVALVAPHFIEKEHLAKNRFALQLPTQPNQPTPGQRKPPPLTFAAPDGQAWPFSATEFNTVGAKRSGNLALEVLNLAGEADVFITLCRGETRTCDVVRQLFIPHMSSLRVTGLSPGSYHLRYRPINHANKAGATKAFYLPDASGNEVQMALPDFLNGPNTKGPFHEISVEQF